VQREINALWSENKVVKRETRRAVTPWGVLSVFVKFLGGEDFGSRSVSICRSIWRRRTPSTRRGGWWSL